MISHIAVLVPQPTTLMYMERLQEGSGNPLIYSTSDPVCHLSHSISLSLTLTASLSHTHTSTDTHIHTSVPYLLS